MHAATLILLATLAADPKLGSRFSEIEIDDAFRQYLTANVLLMEVTGAKVIRLANGGSVVLAVASTAINDNTAKDRLRAERVCRVKALAAIVAEKKGIQVCHVETLNEKTQIVIDEKGETGSSVLELIQVTKTKVEGIAKDMPVVGRWKSKDGEVFYLALGVMLDKKGEPIESRE